MTRVASRRKCGDWCGMGNVVCRLSRLLGSVDLRTGGDALGGC